uniref:Uncharacterized protein n=1 Tax=Mustela putorius furo TaxID=9669 RepID=M3Y4N8_MUSPF
DSPAPRPLLPPWRRRKEEAGRACRCTRGVKGSEREAPAGECVFFPPRAPGARAEAPRPARRSTERGVPGGGWRPLGRIRIHQIFSRPRSGSHVSKGRADSFPRMGAEEKYLVITMNVNN